MKPVLIHHKQILAYQRSDEQAEFLILINLSGYPARFDLKTEGRILMEFLRRSSATAIAAL